MCYPVPLSNHGYKDKHCTTNVFKSFKGYMKVKREGRAINFVIYLISIEILNLCDCPLT